MNTASMLTLSNETDTDDHAKSQPCTIATQQPRIIAVELPRRRLGGSLREVELLQRTQTGGLTATQVAGDGSPLEAWSAAYVVLEGDGPTREIVNHMIYGRAMAQHLYFFSGIADPDDLDPEEFTVVMLEFLQRANADSMRAFLAALQEPVTEGTEDNFDAALTPVLDQAYFLKQAG